MIGKRRFLAMTAMGLIAATGGSGSANAQARGPEQGARYRLLMVVQRGCVYCAAWRREVGPGYPASAEGRIAPLVEVDINGPWPDGLAIGRAPFATPTFILLDRGHEIARIEGYPGAEGFRTDLRTALADAGALPR